MIKELQLFLSNCFGIKQLEHKFHFNNHKANLIYAPNGTMKTSLAKTLRFISTQTKEKPVDMIFDDRKTSYSVLVDNEEISPESLFVFNGEDDIDCSQSFINFLASSELKAKYEHIYSRLNSEKEALISRLKTFTLSTDCEKELVETFSLNESDTIFSIFERVYSQCSLDKFCYKFRYNDIFDAKGNVKAFIDKFKNELQQYFNVYLKLLENSILYRSDGDYHFGTYQVSKLLQMAEDGNFFGVKHKIVLQDGTDITSNENLAQFIENEQNKILTDTNLKKAFDKITKAVDRNTELRGFKSILETHPDWIPEILDYDNFKCKVWLGFLSDCEIFPLFKQYIDVYNANKEELFNILKSAENQQKVWTDIINLYNARFHVPIKVSITNQKDIILNHKAAKLAFHYYDGEKAVETDKKKLTGVLSRGEIRAFYILQFIFEMEDRKRQDKDSVIVLDDVADSFDYQNKYAIIEYIRDLINSSKQNIYMVILTHNYDFYRTLTLRLSIGRSNLWMSERESDGVINIVPGQYRGDVYTNAFVGHEDNDKIFISMIPFVRNLVMYTEGDSSRDYELLTSCLHRKENTHSITERNVLEVISKYLKGNKPRRVGKNNKIFDLIVKTAECISTDTNINSVSIENKIAISIAIRLLTEEFMFCKMTKDGVSKEKLNSSSNQLSKWSQLFKETYPDSTEVIIIEQVKMMTPEFRILNSFMFEPLIDMSIRHLIRLYNKCKELKA